MYKHTFVPVTRVLFALASLSAVVVQLIYIKDAGYSIANFLSFFTIQSNIIAATVLLLSAYSSFAGKWSWVLRLRGPATLYMTVTGVVYILLLRDVDVQTSEIWINTVLHYIMPAFMLLDWIVHPVNTKVSLKVGLLGLIYPLGFLAYSLVRGAFVDWYPYPFLDPRTQGYIHVAIVSFIILIFGLVSTWLLVMAPRVTAKFLPSS